MLFIIRKFREIDICEQKNQPNNPRIDCKSPSNLVQLIEKDLDFEEELENFEGSFKQDELLNI